MVRSRSIVIEVTTNMVMKGKSPTSGAPTRSKASGSPSKAYLQQRDQEGRHDEQERDRAGIAPQLRQDPAARWRP